MSTPMNTTLDLSAGSQATRIIPLQEGWLSGRTWFDWLFAVLAVAGGIVAFAQYGGAMDGYEKAILAGTVPFVIALGWF